ncbi:MAG: hypothetical protein ACEQSK_19120 [Sphingomonadaceae bacterium]
MKSTIFNASLLVGLLLIMSGVAGLHSIAAALLVGGTVLVLLTLLLARWAGVIGPKPKDGNVPK